MAFPVGSRHVSSFTTGPFLLIPERSPVADHLDSVSYLSVPCSLRRNGDSFNSLDIFSPSSDRSVLSASILLCSGTSTQELDVYLKHFLFQVNLRVSNVQPEVKMDDQLPSDLFKQAAQEAEGAPAPVDPPTNDGAAATSEPVTPPAPPEPGTPILDEARERGFNTEGIETDQDWVRQLETHASYQQQLAQGYEVEREEYGALKANPDFIEWQKQREDAAKAEAAKEPEPILPEWGNRPEFDEQWGQYVEYNPSSNTFELSESAPKFINQDIARKYTAAKQWEAQQSQRIVNDFPDLVSQIVEKAIEGRLGDLDERINKNVGGYMQQRDAYAHAENTVQAFLVDNVKHLYAHEDGEMVQDAQGNPQLTESGQRFAQLREQGAQFARRLGVENPTEEVMNQYAMDNWQAPAASPDPPQPAAADATPPPAAVPEPNKKSRLKEEFAKEAKRRSAEPPQPVSNRKVAEAANAATEEISFERMLQEEAKANGLS